MDVVVNMALLLHDIGKPDCYTEDQNGGHFHGHGIKSHDISEKVLTKLRFDNKTKSDILELVLYHDSIIEPTAKTVRRWMNKLSEGQFWRLLDVRMADILAHAKGTQQSRIDRCNALKDIAEEVMRQNQCFKLKDLAINGRDVMALLNLKQGKEVGIILNEILGLIIDEKLDNTKEDITNYLLRK